MNADAGSLNDPEPAFAECVGRFQSIATACIRGLDLNPPRRKGERLRLSIELSPDKTVSARRRDDGYVLQFGLLRLRRIAMLTDHVASAIVLTTVDGKVRVLPAISGPFVHDLDAFASAEQIADWGRVADTEPECLGRDTVRSYLTEAALTFLLHHELGHARLGHVDALPQLLGGVVLDEAEQAQKFGFSDAVKGLEYAADIAGYSHSLEETVDADRFADMPDALWSEPTLRLALRMVGAYLVCIDWHMQAEQDGAHPSALSRFLAMIALPLEAPLIFDTALRPHFDAATRFALICVLQAGRRLRFLQTARDLHPNGLFASLSEEREAARKAMKATLPVVQQHGYIPAEAERKRSRVMRIELKKLAPETAVAIHKEWQKPNDDLIMREIALEGELGDTKSSMAIGAVLSLALGVPSGVAANWVWDQISGADQPEPIVVVIDGQTCLPSGPDDLERLIEAARQP